MIFAKKKIRYCYWLTVVFIKKNLKTILLTFFISFILMIGLVSIYPIVESIFLLRKDVIGISGKYDYKNLPIEVSSKISNGLIFVKSNGSIVPALASSWEIKNNSKQFLIHLKQNLIWNNGKKFTAYDINYQFKNIDIKVIDDNTINFSLKNPLPIFIGYLSKPILQPSLTGVGGLYRTGKVVLKNGLLKEIYLIPNKKGISSLVYKFYENDDQLVIAYKKGEISEFSSSNKTLVDPFYKWKNSQITTLVDYSRLLTLFFNMNDPLLKERDIRSAIKTGINFKKFKDYGQEANTPIPPTSWAYSAVKSTVFDPDTAKKIISNSSSSSQSAQLNLVTYYEYSDLSEIIVNQLSNIGLKIKINFLTRGLSEDYNLLLAYWKIPDDPDQYYFWHSTQAETNIGHYENLKVDKLLEDGRSTYQINLRKKIYSEYQKVISEDPPALFLFYPYLYTVRRK